jgi:tetratricopeptide (TPR) repeat protein
MLERCKMNSVAPMKPNNSTMKNKLFNMLSAVCIVLIVSSATAQPVPTPRTPSPASKVTQTIGISTVTVSYSRPAVRGREVWGKLVPYGWNKQAFGLGNDAPWRAGANENTLITFSHPGKFAGQAVPAGTYGLFFVINQDDTGEVILSNDTKSWGSFFYDAKNDLLRSKIQVRNNNHTELLTYDFINLGKNGGELVLNWEKKQFPVAIEFAVDDIVMANAAAELKGATGFTAQGFNSAANYALANKTNLETALTWVDQAIQINPTFNSRNTKSQILTLLGKNADGEKVLTDAIAAANENELNLYGYQLINQKNFDKGIQMLILNTQRFPKSANAWDSLGEGYALKGDKDNAIKNFKKSLTMNPPANVKANSEKYLKQFGVL